MKNHHYILGAILTMTFAMGQYFASMLVADFDIAIGLEALPFNPYANWPHLSCALTQLTLVSMVAHSALNWKEATAITRALWVFIGLSAWNQTIDAAFGDVSILGNAEVIFFWVSMATSVLIFIKWQRQNGSNL